MVICCFTGMMTDTTIWEDPHLFRPERFIHNGKIIIPEQYLPFGVGKRRCMGEMLAKSDLFLFISTLLQNFSFLVPPGHPIPTAKPLDGATASVRQYTALLVSR